MDEVAMFERIGNLVNSLELAGKRIAELESKLEKATKDWKHALEGVGSLSDQLRAAESRLTSALREIEVLRLYGNKDCTAMADEELARGVEKQKKEFGPASGYPEDFDSDL